MKMGLCLEQCQEALWPEAGLHSRDCSCLAQQWCASSASSTGALSTGCQFLSWSPWGGFAVANRIISGLRFLLLCYLALCLRPHICSFVCKGESNEGSYWWAVFFIFANDCAVFAHSSEEILLFTVLYVLQSTLALQPFWEQHIFCFNQELALQEPSLYYPLIRCPLGLPV